MRSSRSPATAIRLLAAVENVSDNLEGDDDGARVTLRVPLPESSTVGGAPAAAREAT